MIKIEPNDGLGDPGRQSFGRPDGWAGLHNAFNHVRGQLHEGCLQPVESPTLKLENRFLEDRFTPTSKSSAEDKSERGTD